MNSLKCSNCGLTNFADVFDCRRCGESLFSNRQQKKRVTTPRWFSLWSLLVIAGAVGIVYYFYHGVQVSMQELEQQDQQRQAAQSKVRPKNLSRSQAENQRAGSYAGAVSNSQSLKDHQKHIDETEKAMNQVSNSK